MRMKDNNWATRFDAAANPERTTGPGGTAVLHDLADRLGLTDALGEATRPACPPGLGHDPRAVLRDVVPMLADGGYDFSANETMRSQEGGIGHPRPHWAPPGRPHAPDRSPGNGAG